MTDDVMRLRSRPDLVTPISELLSADLERLIFTEKSPAIEIVYEFSSINELADSLFSVKFTPRFIWIGIRQPKRMRFYIVSRDQIKSIIDLLFDGSCYFWVIYPNSRIYFDVDFAEYDQCIKCEMCIRERFRSKVLVETRALSTEKVYYC